jgi:hypothetical protein
MTQLQKNTSLLKMYSKFIFNDKSGVTVPDLVQHIKDNENPRIQFEEAVEFEIGNYCFRK